MYERFTDEARKVMLATNQEAARFNDEFMDTEHMLLAITQQNTCRAAQVLTSCGLNLSALRLEVEKHLHKGPDMVTVGRLPQTPRVRKAVEVAAEEAHALSKPYIATEHLLLGILRQEEGLAQGILHGLQITYERVREKILLFPAPEGDLPSTESSLPSSTTFKEFPPELAAKLTAITQCIDQFRAEFVRFENFWRDLLKEIDDLRAL